MKTKGKPKAAKLQAVLRSGTVGIKSGRNVIVLLELIRRVSPGEVCAWYGAGEPVAVLPLKDYEKLKISHAEFIAAAKFCCTIMGFGVSGIIRLRAILKSLGEEP